MPVSLKAPGVYIEEDASLALSVSNSATAVPVFIGKFTPKEPKLAQVCIRISNWLEFTSDFSLAPMTEIVIRSSSESPTNPDTKEETDTKAPPKARTLSDVENKKTWIHDIDKVNLSPAVQALQLYFQNGGGACYIYPLNGVKDESVLAAIPELIEQKGDITLLVCPETDLDYKTKVYSTLLPLLDDKNVGYFLIADSNDGESVSGVGNNAKAAAYYPQLQTDLKFSFLPEDKDIRISGYEDDSGQDKPKNLADLRKINESIAKRIDETLQVEQQSALILSPSAAIAGIYCRTDSSRGVWKAPANVALTGVKSLLDKVDDERQGAMNDKGINVIRSFTGRGLMVWGARTSVEANNTDWRYIPVRRLFNSVERDIRQALRAVLFETNNQPTWMRAKAAVDQYLLPCGRKMP
ncbi:phage tail sheath subtilisin-like domain-containing protein [Xenorhabdus bovienii]|uniref:phage tail sheath subtilisin-like domain-containing protein n=1 Tax=Xenorhabdus bovienii TaxID=40576 RepID=UPI003DA481E4